MITVKNDSGTSYGTKVLDESGVDICAGLGVECLTMEFGPTNEPVRADIRLVLVKAEVKCGAVRWLARNPMSGEFEAVSCISFASGDRLILGEDGGVVSRRGDDS